MASQRPASKEEVLNFLFDGSDPMEIIRACDAQLTSPTCTHTGTQGRREIAFRCRTCGVEDGCCICEECFLNGNHEGHDAFPVEMGGLYTCDCGTDMWQRDGWCSKHGKTFDGDVTALLPPAAAGLPARIAQAVARSLRSGRPASAPRSPSSATTSSSLRRSRSLRGCPSRLSCS